MGDTPRNREIKDLLLEIPAAIDPPPQIQLTTGNYTLVFFDIETTSGKSNAEICQLSAVHNNTEFNEYVMPSQPIPYVVSEKTHLTINNGFLCYRGNAVSTITIENCLKRFLIFLADIPNPVLVGHNILSFDCRYLVTSIKRCSLLEDFLSCVHGFIDTLPLYKSVYPEKKSHSQEFLVREFTSSNYNAHNAIEDVRALQKLFNCCNFPMKDKLEHSFTFNWIVEYRTCREKQNANKTTLSGLVRDKVLSERMAKKIADSGLTYHHLQLACAQGELDDLKFIFEDKSSGKVRVTKQKRIMETVYKHFNM
ncbi:DNA polymerase III PolC-type-like [Saccoglossus kowalevskii]